MSKTEFTMIEFFSGIGAQKRGIDNTNLYDLKVVATSDVDKEALVEYAAIHHGLTNEMIENYKDYPGRDTMIEELSSRNIGMDFDKGKMYDWNKLKKKKTKDLEKYWLAMKLQNNLGDISKIEQAPEADCWFYSSPCQCFSLAGKQDGIDATCNACGEKYNPMLLDVDKRYICPNCGSDDIKGTRSGLLLEIERLLVKAIETNTAPKYLCLENVKNLVGKQFKPDFDAWVKRLEYLNYNTYWTVLNAKSCGIPQNRERVFAFSIRKDIDTGKYTFPIPFDNGLRLKDVLEKHVEEKFYISSERANNLILQLIEKGQLKKYTTEIIEEWKNINGYENLYQISNLGNVRSVDRVVYNSDHRIKDDSKRTKTLKGKKLNLLEAKCGYYTVNLSKDGNTKIYYVHRLVAEHFIPLINGKDVVNHKDGNKHNNVYTNLEWVTTEENMQHAWKTGLCHSSLLTGGSRAVAKLDKNTEKVLDIYISIAEASRINNYKSPSGISMVISGNKKTAHGYKWKYVDDLINQGILSKQDKEKILQPILVKNQATEVTRIVDTANTLMARDWKGFGNQDMIAIVESEKIDSSKRIGGMFDDKTKHQAGSVWDSNGMSPTLDTMQGGLRQPCIIENTEPKERFFKQAIDTFNNNDCEEGDTIDAFNQRVNKTGYCPTITNRPEGFKTAILPVVKEEIDTSKPIYVGNTTPSGKSQCNAVYSTEGVSQTLCAGTHGYSTGNIVEENEVEFVNIAYSNYVLSSNGEVFVDKDGIRNKLENKDGIVELLVYGSPRQVSVEKLMKKYFPNIETRLNNAEEKTVIGIKQATKKGYIECELPGVADLSFPNSKTRRGRVEDNGQIVPTLTAAEGGIRYIENIYRIRKLTPRETSVLMGFTFEDCDKCADLGVSNSALYKAHGNSIVTNCISLLFEHLYKAQYDESYICTDEKKQNFQKPEVV